MKKKNVFGDIVDRHKYVKQKLIDTPLGNAYQQYLSEDNFLNEIWNFICSGDYGVSEEVRSRCIAVSTMGYRVAMEHCHCKRSALAKSLSRAEPKLCKYIGEATVSLLWMNKLDNAQAVYLTARCMGADGLFPADVLEVLPAPVDTGVSLADCETELKALRYLTKNRIQRRVANLNQDKLSRLRYILLSQGEQYFGEKLALIQALVKPSSKVEFERCQKQLSKLK